jgi:hypothetical protein
MTVKYRDYSLTGAKGLEPDEQIKELNVEKEQYALQLFKEDLVKARRLKLNVARIIRFKFHDWLEEHFPEL